MFSPRRAIFIVRGTSLAVALSLTACGGAAAPSATGSAAPSAVPSPAVSSAPATTTPVPTGAVPTAVVPTVAIPTVAIPTESDGLVADLLEPGRLAICSSFPRPRFAQRDADGKPFGVDIEIGEAIARQMGLEPEVRELLFDDLIDAVVSRRCDLSIAGQFITGARLARIDMIAYREGAPHIVVRAGNPLGIRVLTDICGRSLAVVTGSIYVDLVRGTGDYAGRGIDRQCRAARRPDVELREFPGQREAEDALAQGDVDAYVGNDFVTVDRPQDFALSAELPPTRNGIGLRKSASALNEGVRAAFRALIDDGSYLAVLAKYGVADARVTTTP